jgi:hypothetical protein
MSRTIPADADDLVAQLVQASFNQSRDTASRLIDSLTEQLADSQAEVDAIRARIDDLLAGPYAPSADAIAAALYPSTADRENFRRDRDAA